jgi:hypothetical protein
MKGAPCIRGIKAFKRCPGTVWDGKQGCPLWFEDLITVQEGQVKKEVIRAQCADRWQYDFLWWNNARLAGNQHAVESFRNNMTVDGSPKPDPAMLKLVYLVQEQQRVGLLADKKAREISQGA